MEVAREEMLVAVEAWLLSEAGVAAALEKLAVMDSAARWVTHPVAEH